MLGEKFTFEDLVGPRYVDSSCRNTPYVCLITCHGKTCPYIKELADANLRLLT